jgi:hypothetical protein
MPLTQGGGRCARAAAAAASRLLGFTQIQAEPLKWPAVAVAMPESTVPRLHHLIRY